MLRAKTSQLSFYGDHIYDRVIPKDHFLKLLNKVADFSFVDELCRDVERRGLFQIDSPLWIAPMSKPR